MGAYATQQHGKDGSGVSKQAVVDAGDTFKCNGKTLLRWYNASGATPYDATIVGSLNSDQGFKTDLVITIPVSAADFESPLLDPKRFGATATVTYAAGADADVTAAAVEMNDDQGLT